jgi:hypothetical protein
MTSGKSRSYHSTEPLSARWETGNQPTRLRAQQVGQEGYDFVEQVYADIAKDYLGFTWGYTPFDQLRRVNLSDIWILRENNEVVGYTFAHSDQARLTVTNFLLQLDIDATEAIAAVAAELKSLYFQVKISRPVEITSFRYAGYHVAHPTWGGLMMKSLTPEVLIDNAKRHFGIGTDKFLISYLDVT